MAGEETLLRQCVAQSERLSSFHRAGRRIEAEAVRTAHFYLALQGCQVGRFQEADGHLARLGLSTRLSDNVWLNRGTGGALPEDFFVRVLDDGLPRSLVERVRDSLSPESVYWEEHAYDEPDTGFYSHAHRIGEELHVVDQLIESLRPLLAQVAPETAARLQLAEWWPHHRRPDQWHGHPMHCDTHEQLLRETRGNCVVHPEVSTVVYLGDASPRFGPTLVTNQRTRRTPDPATELATLVEPRLGRVLFFDGGYLHGALPGRPWLAGPSHPDRRLNLMVGWWTTRVEPLPPTKPPMPVMLSDPAARWVQHMQRLEGRAEPPLGPRPLEVSPVAPIWADVPGPLAAHTKPFAGRFFLTHRGQVDEDLFL